jgi:serine protease Do
VHRPCGRFVVADLCLAPGNSGGPLVDAAGSVVGINSMIADGLALAVPTEAVRALFA